MGSEKEEDWDLSLPTTADNISQEDRPHDESIEKMNGYVQFMSYRRVETLKLNPYIESLAKPKKKTLKDNAKQFAEIMVPPERGKRLERLVAKNNAITVVQLENVIRSAKAKERRKESILKQKEQLHYELQAKLEQQCRNRYLDFILKKFSNFIAKLSISLKLPPKLFEPYVRMQRNLFCNIVQCVENSSQNESYCNTNCSKFAECHKLSHALLSLIIKALDLASTRIPNSGNVDLCVLNNFMEDRIRFAVENKLLGSKHAKHKQFENTISIKK